MERFIIHKPEINENKVLFRYSIKRENQDFNFKEQQIFEFDLQDDIALRNLCIASSISYYKLYLVKEIYVDWFLSSSEREFWQWIFRNGFSELVYKNKLDWSIVDGVTFTSNESEELIQKPKKEFDESAVVGIGGGKDSSLVVKLLEKINIPVLGYSTEVKQTKIIEENVMAMGIIFSPVVRKIDEQLKILKENVFLGHIPISLVYAFTGILIAYQKNKKYVFVGNESSAEEENTFWLGRKVNHQWSKTSEFEKKVQDFVHKHVSENLTYASLLRPFASLKIVELFVKNCQSVFKSFSSCNNNFKVASDMQNKFWCGECAKCLGTYLLLGEYLDKKELKDIFGKNLEENKNLGMLFRELLGLEPEKPYDCVATRGEMCFALENIKEEIKKGVLFACVSDKDWKRIVDAGKVGESFKNKIHENFLPKEILEKLLKVIQ